MADGIVIGKDEVHIMGNSYRPDEPLDTRLLWKIHRAAGGEYLPWPPGEKKTAREVAKALRKLGIKALRDCLAGEEIIDLGEGGNDDGKETTDREG